MNTARFVRSPLLEYAMSEGSIKGEKKDNIATPEKRGAFLSYLAEYGNVSKSAESAKLNRPALYRYRDEHEEFAKLWDEAAAIGAQALEDEARRRAYEGTLKPVFHQGEQCGVIREYSDTLMIFLLKGSNPEKYAERQNVNMNASVKADVHLTPREAAQALIESMDGEQG